MAQLFKKNNALENSYRTAKRNAGIGYTLMAIGGVSFVFGLMVFPKLILVWLIFLAVGIAGMVGAVTQQNKATIYRVGLEGEQVTAQIISYLPAEYYGFQNVNVTFDGKTSELDLVVVGPTGVFVIESKNLNGSIYGHLQNPQWIQGKIGRGGTPYSKSFYNPVKQVGTHVYRLANYLRGCGANVFVNAAVFFSHPAATVQMTGEAGNIPVFAVSANGIGMLLQYITARQPVLPMQTVYAVCNILARL
jgi:hypothetical protein